MNPLVWAGKYFLFMIIMVVILCWMSSTGVRKIIVDNLEKDVSQLKTDTMILQLYIDNPYFHKLFTQESSYDVLVRWDK